jgi:hypothetical protein
LELLPCLVDEVVHLVFHAGFVSRWMRFASGSKEEAIVDLFEFDMGGRIRGRQLAVLFTGPGRISPHCSQL